jgi:hypothetical protein
VVEKVDGLVGVYVAVGESGKMGGSIESVVFGNAAVDAALKEVVTVVDVEIDVEPLG